MHYFLIFALANGLHDAWAVSTGTSSPPGTTHLLMTLSRIYFDLALGPPTHGPRADRGMSRAVRCVRPSWFAATGARCARSDDYRHVNRCRSHSVGPL